MRVAACVTCLTSVALYIPIPNFLRPKFNSPVVDPRNPQAKRDARTPTMFLSTSFSQLGIYPRRPLVLDYSLSAFTGPPPFFTHSKRVGPPNFP